MAYFVTVLYLALVILSPAELVPELGKFRIQWWIGGLGLLLTLAMVPVYGYPIRRLQVLLMFGFLGAALFSRIALGWLSGALFAVAELGAMMIVFFLIAGSVNTISRLRGLAIVLTLMAFYAGLRGALALFGHWEYDKYVLEQRYWGAETLLAQVNRIRFVGSLSDPNDLAQYFLVVLPFVLLLWKKRAIVHNTVVVFPLLAYLMFITFLTHSRGVIVGLIAVVIVHLAGRVGKVVSTLGGAALAVLLIAGNFAGGREVSFNAGSDRVEAWSAGVGMWRSRPLVGVGYNMFTDHYEITAHNSFVLCFAELGLIGFFFWLALLVTSIIDLTRLINQHRQNPGAVELVRWASAIRLSMVGFIATCWFLSRTYAVLLYVLLGMTVAILEIEARSKLRTAPIPQDAVARPPVRVSRPVRWLPATVFIQIFCIAFIYAMVRLRWS